MSCLHLRWSDNRFGQVSDTSGLDLVTENQPRSGPPGPPDLPRARDHRKLRAPSPRRSPRRSRL